MAKKKAVTTPTHVVVIEMYDGSATKILRCANEGSAIELFESEGAEGRGDVALCTFDSSDPEGIGTMIRSLP